MFSIAPRFAGRLAKIAFGGLALGLVALSGASAQYYPPGYYGGAPQGYYRGGPPQGYDDGYYRPRRRVPMGSVCVTARGDCQQRAYMPIGGRCFCIIPGFGKKHGQIQY